MICCQWHLYKRYYFLYLLLAKLIMFVFIFDQIKFSPKFHTQRKQMCMLHNKGVGNKKECYLTKSIVPCDEIDLRQIPWNATVLFKDIVLFEDILEAEKQPIPDRTIFFIETSCIENGLAKLNGR